MIQPCSQPSDLTETADNSAEAMHKNAKEIEENPMMLSSYSCIIMEAGHLKANTGESFSPTTNQAFGDFISVTLPISNNLARRSQLSSSKYIHLRYGVHLTRPIGNLQWIHFLQKEVGDALWQYI